MVTSLSFAPTEEHCCCSPHLRAADGRADLGHHCHLIFTYHISSSIPMAQLSVSSARKETNINTKETYNKQKKGHDPENPKNVGKLLCPEDQTKIVTWHCSYPPLDVLKTGPRRFSKREPQRFKLLTCEAVQMLCILYTG